MIEAREQSTMAIDLTRADALMRLGSLTDPSLDDLTRALQMRVALNQINAPALAVDLDGTVLDANDATASLAIERDDLRGRPLWAPPLWHITDADAILTPLIESCLDGRPSSCTIEIGALKPCPLRIEITPIFDPNRTGRQHGVSLLLAEMHSLTDRQETDAIIAATAQKLAAAEDIFRAVAEYTSDLVCLHESDGTFTYVSPSVKRLLDLDANAAVGSHPVDLAHSDTRSALVQALQDASRRGSESTRFRHRLRHRNGSYRWFDTAITPIRDADGVLQQLQSSSRDITKQRETEQSLIKKAFHDELTGLPNKALLIDRMAQAFAASERTQQPIGVLLIDLDGFKTTNDSLGRETGVTALTKVAERLTAIVRPGDTLARIDSDEFVMMCAGTDGARGATVVARRIIDAFEQPFVLEGREVHLGVSIGIATAVGDNDPTRVLDNADTAMFEAKHQGRGHFAIHNEDDQNLALERLRTEEALRLAVENNELRLHYQPELDLESNCIVGFEALVRWQRPGGQLIHPDDFIPLAEESGLIVDIGKWVIAEACRQAATWRVHRTPDQEPVRIWVNLSARQLGDPDLLNYVQSAIDDAGITTDEICLEITESALMGDAETATEQLDELRRLGISLGIDDFGIGWSQFGYLQRLPLDVLKIDRSFVSGLGTEKSATTIVAAIIDLAHALGLIVIAEGVETRQQLDVLTELDCDQALGFHFSPPQSPEAFDEVLTPLA
ncbi:MAG: EAL domain-containing protein [Acidimicrobiales bacterium]|nr:EAL domain-containing protein [Acidimicrobiales bacterium]